MTIQLVANALSHLSSEELLRLSALWRVQASSGQVEAKQIAQAFADALRTRLDGQWIDYSKTLDNEKNKTWRKFWLFKK